MSSNKRFPIGDRAYDGDRLDERLIMYYGIEIIAPHSCTRTRTLTQDGRVLRRYRPDDKDDW